MSDPIVIVVNKNVASLEIRNPSDDGLKFAAKTKVKFSTNSQDQIYVNGKDELSSIVQSKEIDERVRISTLDAYDGKLQYKVVTTNVSGQQTIYQVNYTIQTKKPSSQPEKGTTVFHIKDASGKLFSASNARFSQAPMQLKVSKGNMLDVSSQIWVSDPDGINCVDIRWEIPHVGLPIYFKGKSTSYKVKLTPDQLVPGALKLGEVLGKKGYGLFEMSVLDKRGNKTELWGEIDKTGALSVTNVKKYNKK